jgi:hypothetical protein
MAKVLQQNPDGSILVQEDAQTHQLDVTTGTMEPLATPIAGRQYLLRRSPQTGEMIPEEVVPPPVVPPVNVADYAVSAPATAPAPVAAPAIPTASTVNTTDVSRTATPEQQAAVLDQIQTGGQQQIKGVEQVMTAQAERTAQEYAAHAQALESQETLLAAEVQKERIRQTRVDQAGQQLQNSLDALSSTKIDPNAWYGRLDTGSQISAGLAIALGAVGQAMMGSANNPAMDIINRAIDRDIDAQKANLDTKKAAAQTAGSIYSQMRDQFHDERTASSATQAAMLKLVDVRLQTIASTTKNKELAGQAMQMSGKINEDIAKKTADVLKDISDKTKIESVTTPLDSSKARKEIYEVVKSHPQLKEYAEVREGLREFQLAIKNKALGAGVISFVAKGLKQGSFGPEMLNMLEWQSIPDQLEGALKKRLGNPNTPMARRLSAFLTAKEASMRSDLGPIFDSLDKQAKSVGEPGLQSFFSVGPMDKSGNAATPLTSMLQGRKRVGETSKR